MAEARDLTALIVDDTEEVKSFLGGRVLSRIPNISVKYATNGKEAYQLITENRPDILYTDIDMPEMPGDKLLERLVSEGVKIPTFVISSEIDHRATAAIHHSHRMYTDAQAAELSLPVRQTIAETAKYLEGQIKLTLKTQSNLPEDAPPVPYDFGFNVLTKPFEVRQLIERTKRIQTMIYSHGTNP